MSEAVEVHRGTIYIVRGRKGWDADWSCTDMANDLVEHCGSWIVPTPLGLTYPIESAVARIQALNPSYCVRAR